MEKYICSKNKLYHNLIGFLETETENYVSNQELFNIIEEQNIQENKSDFQEFLYLLLKISDNHQRGSLFFNKIEKILLFLKSNIKQTFSNFELFKIFIHNKKIVLLLLVNKMLFIDQQIVDLMLEDKENKFLKFFYPEIKPFLDTETAKKIEEELFSIDLNIMNAFNEKRQTGENDSYLSELIRMDSIVEFITYSNKANFSIEKNVIIHSIFETNKFLQNNEPLLIEYAAFCGSIQIFKYLLFKNVFINPQIWIYAIHGKNSEIIRLLEENHIMPPDGSYEKCLNEAVKCHHNEIADYIQEYLLPENYQNSSEFLSLVFQSYNFHFIQKEMINKKNLPLLCKYDYFTLIRILFDEKLIDINSPIEFEIFFEKCLNDVYIDHF